jgi:antitoxin component HigA of HigAB toxin-antitoxin module
MADISQYFDKAYEQQEFADLADAPVEAIQGLSENDAKA